MILIGRVVGLGMLALLLSGCIEQEMKITLRADASGMVVVERRLSGAESGLLQVEVPEPDEFKTMALERTYRDSKIDPSRKIEKSVYTFGNLAESLPELEGVVAMMPRFKMEGDRLVVLLRHEMNPYHGMGSAEETNFFYNLEIDFPVPPKSDMGEVEGNRVVWKADAERLKKLKITDIGTLFFKCSISASAIKLDLRPRQVVPKDPSKSFFQSVKSTNLISSLRVRVPILGKHQFQQNDKNGSIEFHLPIDPTQLPLCYKNLRVEQLIMDGQKVVPLLHSIPSGVFYGKDELGQDVPGLPVTMKFGWNSHALKTIDRIQISMDAAVPTKLSQPVLFVDASHPTNSILLVPDHAEKVIAVMDIDHAKWQSAELTLASNLDPSEISEVYLDTEYGLRHPADGIRWTEIARASPPDKKKAKALFGEDDPIFIGKISYPHIPTTSFTLVFSIVEKTSWERLVLQEENIDVH